MKVRSPSASRLSLIAAALMGLIGAFYSRDRLLREAKRSGFIEAPVFEAEGGIGSTPVSAAFLVSSGTGVFRALAIDYLWIRATGLSAKGRFFEAHAIARAITELQPRLPAVWTFLAYNFAYNVAAAFPAEERYAWVLEGIRLLSERGLERNPSSPEILRELAWLFYHKIGRDDDEAAYRYRSELAGAFEVPRGSAEWRELLARWRIEPGFLAEVERRWGIELDFRSAASHALYWAERGLRSPLLDEDRYSAVVLRGILPRAMAQLASRGRPLKGPFGRWYAFIPDLRFAPSLLRALEAELEMFSGQPEVLEDVRRRCLEERANLVCLHFLFGSAEEAARQYAEIFGQLSPPPANLEELVLGSWDAFFLPHREMEEGPGKDDASRGGLSGETRAGPWEQFSVSLTASVYLELAGAHDGARGFRALAELILSRRLRPQALVSLPPLEVFLRAAAVRLLQRWRAHSDAWARIPPGLKALEEGSGPDAVQLGLPEPKRLPFRLELLDPLFQGGRR